MTRLCIVSDSHRQRHELLSAVKSVPRLTAILHAGDEVEDARWLAQRVDWPIYAVAGNWDVATEEFPQERIIDGFGPRIFLTHGHRWKVKEGIQHIAHRANECQADIVVFGHTHTAVSVLMDGLLIVNPGSLAAPRGRRERTFAVLDIERGNGDKEAYTVKVAFYTRHGELADGQLRTSIRPFRTIR
ncbi:phosphoesterase [Alicyclobacillus contaminans]|uniref:metallophosphoesterase family protein n=1 Tax=Alicyclobacillus contaminans TaxID=392016 RepID=UPI0004135279|nr:YfcE family phosphodiesterase [Alicyclobacillus contaminans]GMA52327.1 phosphoesterase [Alicyclobacillus contaminans]